MKTTYKKVGLCPITHRECKLCTIYRGRHYYSLGACKEYLRRLHTKKAAPRAQKAKSDKKDTPSQI